MDVEIRIHGTDLADSVRTYVARRLRFALGRFASRVGRVVVRISDRNGVKGGVDQRCHISAEVVPTGKVVLEQVDTDLFTAIDRASDRVGQAFSREVRKMREARVHRDSIRTLPLGADPDVAAGSSSKLPEPRALDARGFIEREDGSAPNRSILLVR